jgi:hypothetical protein
MAAEGKSYAHDETAQAIAAAMRTHWMQARAELGTLEGTTTLSHVVGAAMVGSQEMVKVALLAGALLEHTGIKLRAAEELAEEIPEIKEILSDLLD